MATESAPSIVPDYAAQGNDPYSQYVRSGQVLPSPAPVAAAPASAAPSPAASPSFDDVVKQAEQANGGKPLDEPALDQLRDSVWAREEPGVWQAHKNSKGAVEAEKNAFNAGYDQWKKGYLSKNARDVPPKASTASTIGDTLADTAKGAASTLGQGAIELGRLVPGGLAAIGDYAAQALTPGHPAMHGLSDWYYNLYDKNLIQGGQATPNRGAVDAEQYLRTMGSTAATRSPIAGGILGPLAGAVAPAFIPGGQEEAASEIPGVIGALQRALPAALKVATPTTLSDVGAARDKGATTKQQEKLLGTGLVTNTAANLIPGAIKGNVLKRAAYGALANAVGGGVSQAIQHNIAPNQIDLPTLRSLAVQGGIGAVIAALVPHGQVRGVKPDGSPDVVDQNGKEVPLTDDQKAQVDAAMGGASPEAAASPQAAAPPGAGIPDEAHQAVVGEARNLAAQPTFHGKLPAEPAARAQEVADRATVIAQAAAEDAGHDWTQMSAEQRQQAAEAALEQLGNHVDTQGAAELLQAQRTAAQAPAAQAAAAKGTPAPLQETGEPPVTPQPGDQTNAQPPAPQMESSGSISPDNQNINIRHADGSTETIPNPAVARATAEAALNGEGSPLPPINTPSDPQGRTSAQAQQAGSPAEIQQHAALDAQLSALRKGLGKRITKATLDKMTLGDKIAMADAMQRQQTATPASKKANVLKATEKVPADGIVNVGEDGQPRQPGQPLSSKTPVITTRDVHLAGGVSQDGNRIYIDKRMPKTVTVDGVPIDVHEAVALHERVEWPLMKEMGMKYHDAHDMATAAENNFIRQKYGVDPLKYQGALKDAIKQAGIENRHPNADIPADLDSQPNVDLGDTKPLEGKVAPARTVGGSPMLPADLSGARPRYNFGTKAFTLQFVSDIDKAAYIAATKGSKADARYVDFVRQQTGMSEDQIRELGTQVRDSIKDQAKTAKAGQLTIDRVYDGESPPKKAAAPVEAQPLEPTHSSESVDPVSQLLEGKVSEDDLADVRALIERAQEGEPADLLDRIKELREDDTISVDEAKQLRQLGRKSARPVGERVAEESISEPLEDLSHERNAEPTSDVGRAAADVVDAAERFTGKGLKSDRARADELVTKVREAFPDSPQHQKAADMLEWVLKQAPHLVRGVSDIVRAEGNEEYGGRFSPITRIIELSSRRNMKASTAVHELLHAAEPLMPAPIRSAIRDARESEINRLASTATEAEKPLFEYLQNGIKAKSAQERIIYMNAARDEILKLRNASGSNARLGELYALTNSSEYWAVHATDMLEKGFANRGVLARLTNWLKGYIGKLRELFAGNPNRSAVIDGLNHVLGEPNAQASGRALRDYDIVRQEYGGQPEAFTPVRAAAQLEQLVNDPKAATEEINPRSRIDAFNETFGNRGINFWRINQTLRRLGFKLQDTHDLYAAQERLEGQKSNFHGIDRQDVIDPLKGYFASHWAKFGKTDIESVDKAGLFFQTHHALTERLPYEYAANVPLSGGAEVSRQRIIDRVKQMKLDPVEGRKQLDQLVAQKATQKFSEWLPAAKGKEFAEGLIRQQADLRQRGMTADTMKDANDLLQRVNDRARQRRIEGGAVAADDPMVKFYGYKWYVPLKGAALDGVGMDDEQPLAPNDLAAITRQQRGYITNRAQLQTAQGRHTWGRNPLLQALVDSGTASEAPANHGFTATALRVATDGRRWARQMALHAPEGERARYANSEFANTKVDTYTGTPATGFAEVRTGRHYDKLPQLQNALIHNDGRTHYIIQYPEGSEVYRGLMAMNTNLEPREFPILKPAIDVAEEIVHRGITKPLGIGKQTRLITRSSQAIGRLLTIYNPVWTGTVQLSRAMMEKPLMLAIKEGDGVIDGMKLAAKSYNDILQGSLTSGPAIKLMMTHNYAALRALGTRNPESFAGYWKRMNDAGGGVMYSEAYNVNEQTNPVVRAIRDQQQNILLKGVRHYRNAAMGFSDALENLSSVGIFRSLVKSGLSDAEAAAKTKDLLNFQQTGTAGKALNGYHAYFRITATINDTMFRAFQHPEGRRPVTFMGRTFNTSLDWGKVARWTAVMAGYAAMKYAFDRGVAGKDENGESNLKKAIANDPYTAVSKAFLPVPDTDHPFALPVGLGFPQLLTAPGTLAAAVAYGDITPSDAAKAYKETLQRNVSVVDPVGTDENADGVTKFYAYMMGALQPTVMQTPTDIMMNRNSFGSPIHTTSPNANEFAADQGRLHTPEFWKQTAQEIQQHTGIDMYPETIQYVAQSWGGSGVNDIIRMTLGQGAREEQGLPNNALASTSRLRVDNADYYYSGQMYKTLDELNETEQQLNHVKSAAGPKGSEAADEAGQQWLQSNPNAARQITALSQLNEAKKTYNKAIADLTNSNASPERKQYQRKLLDSQLRQAVDKAQATLQ